MPIEIEKAPDGYLARVTPPHGSEWETVRPLGRDELIAALREQGCHQTDIGDAFYAADPEWLS